MTASEFKAWAVGKYTETEVSEVLKFASKSDLLAIKTWWEANNG